MRAGRRVMIACRNLKIGRESIEALVDVSGCVIEDIHLIECDLCSLESVRRCAQQINDEKKRLDVLICNAGLGYSPTKYADDEFHSVISS
jgi:NAD(P)-dependent dehydrogenase (short-subunit alcohol dehydrogenase family)